TCSGRFYQLSPVCTTCVISHHVVSDAGECDRPGSDCRVARRVHELHNVVHAWHELDAALGERHMLVPTLVDTVRRHGPHDARLLDTATSCNLRAMAV